MGFWKCMDRPFYWCQKVVKKLYFSWRYTTSKFVSLSRAHPVEIILSGKWIRALDLPICIFMPGITSSQGFLSLWSVANWSPLTTGGPSCSHRQQIWHWTFEMPDLNSSRLELMACALPPEPRPFPDTVDFYDAVSSSAPPLELKALSQQLIPGRYLSR